MRRAALAVALSSAALVGAVGSTPAAGLAAAEKPELSADVSVWTTATSVTFVFSGGAAFECRLDAGAVAFAPCTSPTSYSSLAEGAHSFHVRESAGGPNAPASFGWTIDLTAPVLPADIVAEATSPAGAIVVFAATDNLHDSPVLGCSQAPGSAFPLGATSVSCTATDAAGNTTTGGFTVTVRDTTPPTLAAHPDVIVGQQSPQGAVVSYGLPTAADAADPNPTVACSPAPGSAFPLGDTTVSCVATDAAGLQSAAETFKVVVQAGAVPAEPGIATTVPHLTTRADAEFQLTVEPGVTAECKLDSPLGPGSFTPCSGGSAQAYSGLADGAHLFTVQVTNSIGNVNQASYDWVVDHTPPAPVAAFAAHAAHRRVTLSWTRPIDVDYDRVRVWRKRGPTGIWRLLTEATTTDSRVDRPVVNHVLYRYRIASVDLAGNVSAPMEVRAWPSPIVSPRYLQVVHSAPLVDWRPARRATYYNMQAWRDGRKILSVWPSRSSYKLRSTWSYRGKRHQLSGGRVTVYVWAGFGPKAAVRYGPLWGRTTFVVG